MEHVKIQKNNCIIKLNNKFYPISIIQEGIKSYGENKVSLNKEGDITIKTNNKSKAYEFCDHLLSQIQGGDSPWH